MSFREMISGRCISRRSAAVGCCGLLLLLAVGALPAQDDAAAGGESESRVTGELADHPAAQLVVKYLGHALKREWDEATKLIEPKSLGDLQRRYVERLKQAPTIDEEMAIVRSLGARNVKEVEEMPPGEFYTAYHKSLEDRFNVTAQRLKIMAETLELKVLSVAEEGDDLAHVLVRTRHEDDINLVENLELISLIKRGGKWLVSLNEQGVKLTPLTEHKAAQ